MNLCNHKNCENFAFFQFFFFISALFYVFGQISNNSMVKVSISISLNVISPENFVPK